MNRRILFFIFLFVLSGTAVLHAQQEPNYTQSMFYGITMNPAVAGSENAICATLADRMQWVGFKDDEGNKVAPETFFVSIMTPLKFLHGGVSAVVTQDKLGFEKNIGLKFGYAYQKNVGFGKMGIGAHIEFNNKSYDFSKFKYVDQNDPYLSQVTSKESDMLIDFSLGFYYNVPGEYHIGIAGLHLVQTKGKVLVDPDYRMILDRTIIIHGGYQFIFPRNPDFEFDPSAVIRTDLASVQFDVTGLLKYKDIVWGGVGYRFQDAVLVMVGLQYKDFRIGYSYDINAAKFKKYFGGGTHEIMINYCFKLEFDRGRKSYKNTRFL